MVRTGFRGRKCRIEIRERLKVLIILDNSRKRGKYMKRLIVTMFLLLMLFSLSACNGRETDQQEQDKAEHVRPELVNHVENMEQYDVIFLGFPKMEYGISLCI